MAKQKVSRKKYVKTIIPRIPGAPAEQQFFVFGINGKNYRYPRGIKISVLDYIADHIDECLNAERVAEENAEAVARRMARDKAEVLLGARI